MLAGTSFTFLQRLKSLLVHLMEWNIVSPTECDNVSNQYSKFLEQDLKKYHFEKFDQKCDQLDDGIYFHGIQMQQYKLLSFVLRLILTLSYFRTARKQCFSINNNILTQNMNAETVTARKVIKDHMLLNKLDAATIEVNKILLKAAGSTSRK